MEINKCNSAISAYKVNNYDSVKRDLTAPVSLAKNCDKADFSVPSNAKSINRAKISIKNKIEEFASPEKIENLKKMIADGTYNVPIEAVAASIFEG